MRDRCLRLWRIDDAFMGQGQHQQSTLNFGGMASMSLNNRGLLASMECDAQITGIVFNSCDYFYQVSRQDAKPNQSFIRAWQPDQHENPADEVFLSFGLA